MIVFEALRSQMVRDHIAARGVKNDEVLAAMSVVPREEFVPQHLVDLAYEDVALPIALGQTISQPYVVAEMIDAAGVTAGQRVLEIGAGSGYAAAILAKIAAQVVAIERHAELARAATTRLRAAGSTNVQVIHGDGTLGWPALAPYDAILVSAGGPEVPPRLREQLAIGGKLVMPIGSSLRLQRLTRITRRAADDYAEEDLGPVHFVPLIGEGGWPESVESPRTPRNAGTSGLGRLINEHIEPIGDIETVNLDALLDRIGSAQVVLLGEATHGTAEFYNMRARITRDLITQRGFRALAIEADWPDAAALDRYVSHLPRTGRAVAAFARFPTWMWRNEETLKFTEWLRSYNSELAVGDRARVFGLDLYSLNTSANAVVNYLQGVDPLAASIARTRYACLTPWEGDPSVYGHAAATGHYRDCESQVVQTLSDLLARRLKYSQADGEDFLDAVQNARLVANAERYYRAMYYGSVTSWNLRDRHMFETLESLLTLRGENTKVVVWAHNSHIGDARATEMHGRGETNVGRLCREHLGPAMYNIGFGTDHGTVAAARGWDKLVEILKVRPALSASYEHSFHASDIPAGLLALRYPQKQVVRDELLEARLERAIGVVYRADTERESHYFEAVLPEQFDEYIWFDRSTAISPLQSAAPQGVPDTYPFGL